MISFLFLIAHICSGFLALLTGFTAILSPKGKDLVGLQPAADKFLSGGIRASLWT